MLFLWEENNQTLLVYSNGIVNKYITKVLTGLVWFIYLNAFQILMGYFMRKFHLFLNV